MMPPQNKSIFLKRVCALLLLFTAFSSVLNAQAVKKKTKTVKATGVVDASTMSGKILAGYQGWFRTPGDRPGSTSWAHVFNSRGGDTGKFLPARLALDTWPDMKEYDKDEGTVVPG